ncbi:hypothetical protein [Kitasatospora sp. A2-31]|uniref:hypothetical protein n=1 Tax=Kitasatospora sp. A2-31 TaxID=2916414 RepID=UPI001EE87FBC|nr:hypothetical protein [Kitasatospora sp. A2-31]MCG6493443.1 hypothetical protein [Kitasatospora sp. A2-31]
MGYKVQRNTYQLTFKGTEFDGLEVRIRGLNTGQMLELEAARLAREAGGETGVGATRQMTEMLASALVSWNAEDEDTGLPIPPTLEGLLAQDASFNAVLIDQWTKAMVGVPAPLPPASSDGQPSLEASIPMDVPSPSRTS